MNAKGLLVEHDEICSIDGRFPGLSVPCSMGILDRNLRTPAMHLSPKTLQGSFIVETC